MDTTLLYKVILLLTTVAAFFLYDSKKYQHRIRTVFYTIAGLMTILCTNEWGLIGAPQPAMCLFAAIALGWCLSSGIPGIKWCLNRCRGKLQ